MLVGQIYTTSNLDIIYQVNQPLVIFNMNEDTKLSKVMVNCVEATCLLPPVDAMIAESDNNVQMYDMIYAEHLQKQYEFIAAIIEVLRQGKNVIIYLPDNGFTYTKIKFMQFMHILYGLHIGDMDNPSNNQCFYDMSKLPLWLNILYTCRIISLHEWLLAMPVEATINGVIGGNPEVFRKAAIEFNAYTEDPYDIQGKMKALVDFHQKLKVNPNLQPAIVGVITC